MSVDQIPKDVWKNIIIPDIMKCTPNNVYTLREVNWFFNRLISPLEITQLLFKLCKEEVKNLNLRQKQMNINIFDLLTACFHSTPNHSVWLTVQIGITIDSWLQRHDFLNNNKILPAFLHTPYKKRFLTHKSGYGTSKLHYYPPLANAVCKVLEPLESLEKRVLMTYCSWPLAKEIFKRQILDPETFKNLFVKDRYGRDQIRGGGEEYHWVIKNCPMYQPIFCNNPELHKCSKHYHCPGCNQFNPNKWERIYCTHPDGCTECFKGCSNCYPMWQHKHEHYFVMKCLNTECENKKRMIEHHVFHCSFKCLEQAPN